VSAQYLTEMEVAERTNINREDERLLNARQVADKLGVSERWVRDHTTRRNPRIRAIKMGMLVRYRRADVDLFMQEMDTLAERAAEGDARAAAQLRGWRYADQRNQRRLNATLEPNALHFGPDADEESSDWSEFMQQRLVAQQRAENLAGQIATARIWTINRSTGDVSYTLNGKLSVIDRGRRVTVLNQNEAAIVFGLEMAVQKYGSRIACSGGDDWKRQVVKVAVQNGIFVEFTEPEMRDALYQHRLVANPLQVKAARLHALETRLQNEDTSGMLFTNEADVHLLLSCLQPAAHSQQLLQILKATQESEPKANVGGNLTVAVVKTPDGRQSFRVSIDEAKRKHVLERVEQVRQSAQWALRARVKAPGQEREGR